MTRGNDLSAHAVMNEMPECTYRSNLIKHCNKFICSQNLKQIQDNSEQIPLNKIPEMFPQYIREHANAILSQSLIEMTFWSKNEQLNCPLHEWKFLSNAFTHHLFVTFSVY